MIEDFNKTPKHLRFESVTGESESLEKKIDTIRRASRHGNIVSAVGGVAVALAIALGIFLFIENPEMLASTSSEDMEFGYRIDFESTGEPKTIFVSGKNLAGDELQIFLERWMKANDSVAQLWDIPYWAPSMPESESGEVIEPLRGASETELAKIWEEFVRSGKLREFNNAVATLRTVSAFNVSPAAPDDSQ